jgi:GNAT superfamily N-acetyltransferase
MRVEPIATQLTLTRSPLTLALEPAPDRAIIRAIASGLETHNALFTPLAGWTPRWIIGRDEGHAVQAGVQFIISLDWLFLLWLWVAEPHRKLGIGSQLLSGAEETARKSDCRAAYVDTFQFQTPEFYQRHGYREFARLVDFPPGHARGLAVETFVERGSSATSPPPHICLLASTCRSAQPDPMLWKISVEAKMPGDPRTVYRLRIDDTVIAEKLTTAQAEFLVREILDRETDEAKMTGASFWPRLEGPRRPGQRRSIFRRGAP